MRAKGSLELRGPTWWLTLQDHQADPDTGEIRRRRRRMRIGPKSELRSRVAARAAADAYFALLRPEELAPGPQLKATAYFEHFLATHVPLYRASSRRKYRNVIRRHLVPAFARRRLDQIDVAAIQALIAELAPRLARWTVKSVRGILLQILRQAIRDGYGACKIDSKDVRLPKAATVKPEPRAIGDDELAQILEASTWPYRALWAVMGLAGLRIGEALGLTWQDVYLERQALRIRQNCVAGMLQAPKTARSQTDVPIIRPLHAILVAYREAWRPNDAGLLFAGRRGAPLASDYVRRCQLAPLLARLGLRPAGCHAFRHGLPARLSAAGLSPDAIQRLMRHATLAMTEHYLHLSAAEFAAAIAKANEQLEAHYKARHLGTTRHNSGADAAGTTASANSAAP